QGHRRQEGRRSAEAAEALGIEGGKVLIAEEAVGGGGELAVEALRIEGHGKDVADIKEVALGLPFSEHDVLLLPILPGVRFTVVGANFLSIFRCPTADFSAALLGIHNGLPSVLLSH